MINRLMQPAIAKYLSPAAVETEIPIPVANAAYATMQSGHLGIAMSNTEGRSQLITDVNLRLPLFGP